MCAIPFRIFESACGKSSGHLNQENPFDVHEDSCSDLKSLQKMHKDVFIREKACHQSVCTCIFLECNWTIQSQLCEVRLNRLLEHFSQDVSFHHCFHRPQVDIAAGPSIWRRIRILDQHNSVVTCSQPPNESSEDQQISIVISNFNSWPRYSSIDTSCRRHPAWRPDVPVW